MKPISSPHERSFLISGERLVNGRRLADMAHRWMECNKDAFFAIYRHVKSMQGTGIVGRIRDRVAIFCAEHGIEVGDGSYLFGNDYWSGIVRYLALYDDTLLGDHIKLADSDIDCHGLWPVSYLPEIGKDTTDDLNE